MLSAINSVTFDRVWHMELAQKLKDAGVTGEILNCFKRYLSNTDRKQRVAFLLLHLTEYLFGLLFHMVQ